MTWLSDVGLGLNRSRQLNAVSMECVLEWRHPIDGAAVACRFGQNSHEARVTGSNRPTLAQNAPGTFRLLNQRRRVRCAMLRARWDCHERAMCSFVSVLVRDSVCTISPTDFLCLRDRNDVVATCVHPNVVGGEALFAAMGSSVALLLDGRIRLAIPKVFL